MCKIAIVGAGPSGCMAACNLNKKFEVTLFDKSSPLKTLLPTGGGKCNLAHAEYDFKELAKSYPRGEKFLYSVFSKFSTAETLDFFEKIGVKTYTREDNRIFPLSNSSQDVRTKILNQMHHCKFKKEEVLSVKKIDSGYEIKTTKAKYFSDIVIVAIGGKSSYKILQDLGHTIVSPKPALVGLKTKQNFKNVQGVTIKNCKILSDKKEYFGNILFTNDGITGPPVFELSSVNARKSFPYEISVDFINEDLDLQKLFDENPHKNLGNLLAEFLPKSIVNTLFSVDLTQKCHAVRANTKVLVNNFLRKYKFEIVGTRKDGETVACGGVSLGEINSKNFESKLNKNLYIIGEVLDIDGFCGGYNLQYCWSSGYLSANSINDKCKKL